MVGAFDALCERLRRRLRTPKRVGSNSYFFIAASAERELYFEAVKDLEVVMFVLRSRPVGGTLYDRLVFVEEFTSMRAAQARLNQIKRMSAKKRAALVAFTNPEWNDLAQAWFPMIPSSSWSSFDFDDDDGEAMGGIGARIPAGPAHPPRSGREAKALPNSDEASASRGWP